MSSCALYGRAACCHLKNIVQDVITETCLYNFDPPPPLSPTFYIVKTGVYRGIQGYTEIVGTR